MYYVPQDAGDAEMLAERISPRLQHANSAVVLTTTKVIMYLMNYMSNEEEINQLCRKLAPPLGIYIYITSKQLFFFILFMFLCYSHLTRLWI